MKKASLLNGYWKSFLVVLGVAMLLRFLGLNTYPPQFDQTQALRILTATLGVFSIGIYMVLVQKLTRSRILSLTSGLILGLMPWHIEQSRIASAPLWGLTVLLGGLFLIVTLRNTWLRIAVVVGACLVFWRVYPSFWPLVQSFIWPGWSTFLLRLFRLISVEFLFFANDSFWWGGLRTIGVFTVGLLPFFLAGCLYTVIHFNKQTLKWGGLFVLIWIIAALTPHFPEGREFFLTTPFLALISGLGLHRVWRIWRAPSNMVTKLIIAGCVLFFLYDYIIFIHFYTNHYSPRIRNETLEHRPIF